MNGHQLIHPSQLFQPIWMYLGLRAKMSDRLAVSSRMHSLPTTSNTRIIAFVVAGMVYIQRVLDLKSWRSLWIQVTLTSFLHRFSVQPTPFTNTKPCGPSRSGAIPIKASKSDSKSCGGEKKFKRCTKMTCELVQLSKNHDIVTMSLPHTSRSESQAGPFTIQLARWVAVHS